MTGPANGDPTDAPQCIGVTASGSRCRAAVPHGRTACLFHDPERVEEAAAARARGGRAGRKHPIRLDDPEPALAESPDLELTLDAVAVYLGWCIRQTTGGRMDPDRLRSIVPGITALRGALTAKALAGQVRELSKEVKRLKTELAKTGTAKQVWE